MRIGLILEVIYKLGRIFELWSCFFFCPNRIQKISSLNKCPACLVPYSRLAPSRQKQVFLHAGFTRSTLRGPFSRVFL